MFHWKKLRQKVEVTTMASFDQKLRTLYLMERTDDEHMLNASELCTILDQEWPTDKVALSR